MLPAHVFVVLSEGLLLVFRGQAVVHVKLHVLQQVVLQKGAAGEAPPTGQTRVADVAQVFQAQVAPLGVDVTEAGVLHVVLESAATVSIRRACTTRVDVRRGCTSGATVKEAAGRHNGLDFYHSCLPMPGVRTACSVLRAVTRLPSLWTLCTLSAHIGIRQRHDVGVVFQLGKHTGLGISLCGV